MAKNFASTGDLSEKKITFSEIGTDLYAFTAEGDPNTAIIVGDDGCLCSTRSRRRRWPTR